MSSKSSSRFVGKTVIVTGSSNGIGRAIAVHFAREGANVTITGRNAEALEETRKECLAAGAPETAILAIRGSLDADGLKEQLVSETAQKFGGIDYLINNAGVGDIDNSRKKPGVLTQDIENYDYIMNINLRCVVQLIKLSTPHLEKTKGAIVNISSIASSSTFGSGLAYYSMSKAALDQLTRSAALELIRRGIRINTIKPGAVSTQIMQKQGISDAAVHAMEEQMSSSFNFIPAKFIGQPDDIAHLTTFLCHHESSRYIVGQCISVDGGTSLVNPMLLGEFADELYSKPQ